MYNIFIDESGIHKQVDNSVYALVYIEMDIDSNVENKIILIEEKLKIDLFHWSKVVWKVKEEFLKEVLRLDFKVKLAIIKNPVNPKDELERVLKHLIIEKNIKNIYIDSKKPKWYERKIKKILRDKGVVVKKLKCVNDGQFAGVRLADMVAGLSRSYYDKKNFKRIEKYYLKLKKKIEIIVE